jgi:hypothetical protein
MRHRPLSRWRSAIGPVWLRPGRSSNSLQGNQTIGNAPGICLTLRSFVPALQGNCRSSRQLEPRLSFNERPPRRIFCGGSIAKSASAFVVTRSIDQGTFISTSGICTYPAASGMMTDLSDRTILAALGFSCFRSAGHRNRCVPEP